MADAADPRMIAVPGPHTGASWPDAGLPPPQAGLFAPVGDGSHLLLPAAPDGSFGLACRDGSLGRLTLPRGIAVDHRLRVYLLDGATGRVLRHDPSATGHDPKRPFVPLPGVGNDPRADLASPCAIAVDSHSLYLADGELSRVLVYSLDGLALREVWRFQPPDRPRDVIAAGGRVFIVAADAVYVFEAGDIRPRLLLRATGRVRLWATWTRAAVDNSGRLYLLEEARGEAAQLQVFDPERPGPTFATIADPGTVRDRFPFPAVVSIPDEWLDPPRYVMPGSLARGCGPARPMPRANRTLEDSVTRVETDGGFVFDSHGARVEPSQVRPARTRLYQTGARTLHPGDSDPNPDARGVWISRPLDSKMFRCRWDTAELEFAGLPAGAAASVQTFIADDDQQDVWILPEEAWIDGVALTGTNRDPAADSRVRTDFLVDGPPGRYLWLRVRLRGDGFTTPTLTKIEMRFPRRSYLEHLPAVFSEDDQSRRFLERFLAVFQSEWDRLEDRVEGIAGLFDPAAVPPSHLDFLAGWFGVTFENGWPAAARRHLLERLPGLTFTPRRDDDDRPIGPRRGTPAALRDFLAAVLPSVADDPDLDTRGFPFVVEGFRERDYRMLAAACAGADADPLQSADRVGPVAAAAGPSAGLFGPDQIGRFQLGSTSRLDEAKLLPAERPDLDLFQSHAHRFRVVVPQAWVRTPAAEAALRRAIDAEKPAHTAYRLDLVGPRFQIGVQSTIGVDTILAGPEPLRLGRPAAGAVLGRADADPPDAGPFRLHPASRLGVDAVRM